MPALDELAPADDFHLGGFDAHVEDDMAGLRFTEADYAWVTQRIKEVRGTNTPRKDRIGSRGRLRALSSDGAWVTHLKVLGAS